MLNPDSNQDEILEQYICDKCKELYTKWGDGKIEYCKCVRTKSKKIDKKTFDKIKKQINAKLRELKIKQ